MSKTIINGSNDFFDLSGSEGDVMYNFRGNHGIKRDSVLYGKTVNLSDMYDTMLDDVREFLFGGEFVNIIDRGKNKLGISQLVNKYTTKKYGISIESVYNKIHDNIGDIGITTDIIFNELKVKYGITAIDWIYLYNNMNILTNDVEILEYMGNRILSNDIHEYFVTEYNLRAVGVVKKVTPRINKNKVMVDGLSNFIKMEWNNGGNKDVVLSNFMQSYNQWWVYATRNKKNNRNDIKEYDKLIEGRSVTEVFPVYCPVFSNLRMNYTSIDFDNGKNNIKKCSEIAGYSDMGETWSFASIDRIDSSKGYSYDNVRIISQYANYLKNVGNINQWRRLLRYMDEQNSYF
jgi:hypothetical protein